MKSVFSSTACTSVPNAAPLGRSAIGDGSPASAAAGVVVDGGTSGSSTVPGASASLVTPAAGCSCSPAVRPE